MQKSTGAWFNIVMPSYQYRKSHCGDKMILRPSYLHNGISYIGKTTSLYWIRAQKSILKLTLGSTVMLGIAYRSANQTESPLSLLFIAHSRSKLPFICTEMWHVDMCPQSTHTNCAVYFQYCDVMIWKRCLFYKSFVQKLYKEITCWYMPPSTYANRTAHTNIMMTSFYFYLWKQYNISSHWKWVLNEMETPSASLPICEGNPPVTGGFLAHLGRKQN